MEWIFSILVMLHGHAGGSHAGGSAHQGRTMTRCFPGEAEIPLAGNESGNVRNGARPKTVLTEDSGHVASSSPGTGTARSSHRSSGSGSGG
jgi:hypothetical protein